jgi:hypothetical protein
VRTIQVGALGDDPRVTWRAAVEGGFFGVSDKLTPEEIHNYWHPTFEHCWGPQPFQITADYAAASVERIFSPKGPSGKLVRLLRASSDYTFWGRTGVGLMSMLGRLRPRAHWGAIAAEYHWDADPGTPMGVAERSFRDSRGITLGL